MSNLAGYGGFARSGLKDRMEVATFWDDFFSGYALENSNFVSATVDQARWAMNGDTGSAITNSDTAPGGIAVLYSDGTSADRTELILNGEQFYLSKGKKLYFVCRVAGDDISDMNLFVGLTQTSTAVLDSRFIHETAGSATDLDRVGFFFGDNTGAGGTQAANIIAVCAKATNCIAIDTGEDVADATLATFNTTSRIYAFEWDGVDTLRFFLADAGDGPQELKEVLVLKEGQVIDALTVAIPTALPLVPIVGIKVDDDAAARSTWLDYVGVAMER